MCVVLAIFILIRVICCKFLEPAWLWLNFPAMPRLCNTILEEKILKETKKRKEDADLFLNFLGPGYDHKWNKLEENLGVATTRNCYRHFLLFSPNFT